MKKTIITEFFTTISKNHFKKSLVFMTYKLPFIRKGKYVFRIEKKFLDYLNLHNSRIISFYNARSALFHAFKMIGIKKDDEIIINSYNCISVVNSVIQAKGIPIYAEINKNNLSIDYELLEGKITSKTKAIVLQHTFGKSASIKKINEIALKYNLIVIEDCTHSLGSKFNDLKHGSFGDFAIFSMGRDKVISGVNGGFLVINNKSYFKNIGRIKANLIDAPILLVYKNLSYNIYAFLAYYTYNIFGLGKVIIHLSRKFGLINEILDADEKKCNNDKLNYKLPNSLAFLALNDLHLIFFYQRDREEIALYYDENIESPYFKPILTENKNEMLNYFRYPIIFKDIKVKNDFYDYMKNNGVLLGNSWSDTNIVPRGINLEKTMYNFDCPLSEEIASKILFLPNNKNIDLSKAKKILKLINNYEYSNI